MIGVMKMIKENLPPDQCLKIVNELSCCLARSNRHNAVFLVDNSDVLGVFFQGCTQYMTLMLYIVQKINHLAY